MNLPSAHLSVIGLALFSFACSDPPSPPNQGAVLEYVQTTPGAKVGCSGSGPQFTAPPNADAVSGTANSLNCDISTGCKPNANIVVDGDQGATVKCSVTGGGDSFSVSANLAQGDVAFSIQGTLGGTGGKAFVSSAHAQHGLQDTQCDITIEPNKGSILAGAIWASFNCTKFGDPSIGEDSCTATGKFIFENCGK